MSTKNKGERAQAVRKAKQLREQLRVAYDSGDYRLAGQLGVEITKIAPDSEPARAAGTTLRNLKLEPWAVYAGAFASVIWAASLLLAL